MPAPFVIHTTGSVLHGYRLGPTIGSGGMGTVYRAEQISLHRQVALKILRADKLSRPGAVEDFHREAAAAARLNHPHLIAVHDLIAKPEEQLFAYAMELVEGHSGRDLLARRGPLPWAEAFALGQQVASALGAAHRSGFVHRDVTPANLLVTEHGHAKLLDLGFAYRRWSEPDPGTPATRRVSVTGTVEYAAPEHLRNPSRAVPASDVWSLGATLYHLIVGRPPFLGETLLDLAMRVAADPVEYPATLDPRVVQVLDHLLAKDRHDRPQDGGAAQRLLEDALAGKPVPPLPQRAPTPNTGQQPSTSAIRSGLHPAAVRRRAKRAKGT